MIIMKFWLSYHIPPGDNLHYCHQDDDHDNLDDHEGLNDKDDDDCDQGG